MALPIRTGPNNPEPFIAVSSIVVCQMTSMDIKELLRNADRAPAPLHFIEIAREILTTHGFAEDVPEKSLSFFGDRALVAKRVMDNEPPIVFAVTLSPPAARVTSLKPFQAAPAPGVSGATFVGRDLAVVGKITFRSEDTDTVVRVDNRVPFGTCKAPAKNADPLASPSPFASFESLCSSLGTGKIVSHDLSIVDCEPPTLVGVDESLMCGHRLGDFTAAYLALLTFCGMQKSSILCIGGSQTADELNWVRRELDGVKCELVVNVTARRSERKEIEDTGLEIGGGVGIVVRRGVGLGAVAKAEAAAEKADVRVSRCGNGDGGATLANFTAAHARCDELELAMPVLGRGTVRDTTAVDDAVAMDRLLRELFHRE